MHNLDFLGGGGLKNIFASLFDAWREQIKREVKALNSVFMKALEIYREGIEAVGKALEEISDILFGAAEAAETRRAERTKQRQTRLRESRDLACMRVNGSFVDRLHYRTRPRGVGPRMGWVACVGG